MWVIGGPWLRVVRVGLKSDRWITPIIESYTSRIPLESARDARAVDRPRRIDRGFDCYLLKRIAANATGGAFNGWLNSGRLRRIHKKLCTTSAFCALRGIASQSPEVARPCFPGGHRNVRFRAKAKIGFMADIGANLPSAHYELSLVRVKPAYSHVVAADYRMHCREVFRG